MNWKKFDRLRRDIFQNIARSIGNNHVQKRPIKFRPDSIKKVLICRPNQRLGNLILITPTIQELIHHFPYCRIDIITKGTLGKVIFKEFSNVNSVIILPRKPFKELRNYIKIFFEPRKTKYDLTINIDSGSSSGIWLTYLANSKFKLYRPYKITTNNLKEPKDFAHMAKNNVYTFRYFLKTCYNKTVDGEIPNLSINLKEHEIEKGHQIVKSYFPNDVKKTLAIFTYATGNKCYSKQWWMDLMHELDPKIQNDYNIIEILPKENISQVDFKYPTYYIEDVREIASVIANCDYFIGADSGIMHLASSSQTTVIGLFSVTREYMYQPYGNESISLNTNDKTTAAICEEISNKLNSNRELLYSNLA